MEVLGYGKMSKIEFQKIHHFLSFGNIYNVESTICDKVIEIKRELTKKNTPDLIIAATALVNNAVLLTNNIKDFKNIPGLQFENPWDWQ